MLLHDLLFRLRSLIRHSAADNELDDELRFHLERQIDKYVRSGMSEAQAVRRARLESASGTFSSGEAATGVTSSCLSGPTMVRMSTEGIW